MDTKKGLINIIISIIGKFVILFFLLLTRRLLIKYLGNEYNGVNSLYTSIIGFLAVAELGVGSAITFSMYKPIVNNDIGKVAALYQLYKKIYAAIGGFILITGLCVIPFLPLIAKDYDQISVNFSLTFFLALVAVVLSYFYSANTSLINAYKNNYITSLCHTVGISVQSIIQIVVLIRSQSFELFLTAQILGTITQWFITSYIARKKYDIILTHKKVGIDSETKKEIVKNVRAMFMHRIGTALVNTSDSIIISSFIGVTVLGKYSNYTTLVTAMISVIALCFSSLTSIVGHMFVKMQKKELESWFVMFYYMNYVLGFVCFLGFYAIVDGMIKLLFGNNLELSRIIVITITINYFVQFMRQAALLFRDASGSFYYDRWKPLAEGIVNVVLSVLFVIILPEEYKVAGVIIATIITNLLICHYVEPHIVYKYALRMKESMYLVRNYIFIVIFVIAVILFDSIRYKTDSPVYDIVVNGFVSILISVSICCALVLLNRQVRTKIKALVIRKAWRRR